MSHWQSEEQGFAAAGLRGRGYFDHAVVELAKGYPDARLLLERRGVPGDEVAAGSLFQLNLYASEIGDLPSALFADCSVNWHGQGFGRDGLVAAAGVFVAGDGLAMVTLLQSDLVQQVHRSAAWKSVRSRIENRFRAWPMMALQAVLAACLARGLSTLLVPDSRTITGALRRAVDGRLFARVYDAPAQALGATSVTHHGCRYWRLRLDDALRARLGGYLEVEEPARLPGKTVCIFHDIEEDVDAPTSAAQCRAQLARMLAVERDHNVRGTYNVLGTIFPRVAPAIAADGHELAFHSFDHDVDRHDQLPRVREVDLQVKGYRPPRSLITPELSPRNLAWWNFEWLATSAYSLGRTDPFVVDGIAHLPIETDDYALFTGEIDFERWFDRLLGEIRRRDFVAFSLHDCYAGHWLPRYDAMLEAIGALARTVTADEVAGAMFVEAAQARRRPLVDAGTLAAPRAVAGS